MEKIITLFFCLISFGIAYADVYEELHRQGKVIETIYSGNLDFGGVNMFYRIISVRNLKGVINARRAELERGGFSTTLKEDKHQINLIAIRQISSEKVDMISIQGLRAQGGKDIIIESKFNPMSFKNILSIKADKIEELKMRGFIILDTDKRTYFETPGVKTSIFIQFMKEDHEKVKTMIFERMKSEKWIEVDKDNMFKFFEEAVTRHSLDSLLASETIGDVMRGEFDKARQKYQLLKQSKEIERKIRSSTEKLSEIMKDIYIFRKDGAEMFVQIKPTNELPKEYKTYLQQYLGGEKTLVLQILIGEVREVNNKDGNISKK
ncbi:MAG: hypothetical protein QXI58_05060 [Candidatus Micrarchaeia archaeon]